MAYNMQLDKFNLVHIADLRCMGGVERMLIDFILSTPHIQHHLILQGLPVHKSFQAALSSVSTIHCSKYFLRIPLPKSARVRNRARQINKLKADKVLVWNQVVDLTGVQIPCLYYEHGSAWYEHTSGLIQKCFVHIHLVIAVSNAAKRVLQLKHQLSNSIIVVHNVLPAKMNQTESLPRVLPKNRAIVLGCAGRLVSVKCLGVLVLSIYELQQQGFDVIAKIAGVGGEAKNLYALIKKYHLEERVQLLGLVNDMSCFYQDIDIYVSTSIHESFGLTVLEAASYGIPVIAANVDGLPEVIEHNQTGFCIEPTLNVDEFIRQTGASKPVIQDVYFPLANSIGKPKVLAPNDVAKYVVALLQEPMCYQKMSANAVLRAKQSQPFTELCKNILALCEQNT